MLAEARRWRKYNDGVRSLRWLIFDYVDPELKLSAPERRAVRREARQHVRPNRRSFLLGILIIAPLLAFYIWGVIHYGGRYLTDVWPVANTFIRVVLVYAALWIVAAWLGRIMYRPFVLRAVRDRGYDVCLNCGYWLRGLEDDEKSSRCPECGKKREPWPGGDGAKEHAS